MIKWSELLHRKKNKYCPETHDKLKEAHDKSTKRANELAEELDQTIKSHSKQRVKHS